MWANDAGVGGDPGGSELFSGDDDKLGNGIPEISVESGVMGLLSSFCSLRAD